MDRFQISRYRLNIFQLQVAVAVVRGTQVAVEPVDYSQVLSLLRKAFHIQSLWAAAVQDSMHEQDHMVLPDRVL